MVRIAGINLEDNWKADFALTKVKGVGWPLSQKILSELKIPASKRIKDLTSDDVSQITAKLENYSTEGELVREVRGNIQRLQAIGAYRGVRHNRGLPVRGQRTRSNARTKRGKRKTVGAFKKEELTKAQNPAKSKEGETK